VLYFVSTQLTLCYLLFAFLSALGILQVVAVHYRLNGLAFLDYSEHPWMGYALGALLVLAGAAIYLVSQWPMIFAPGPAGAELSLLFSAAALCAAVFTLVLVSFLQPRRAPKSRVDLPPGRVVTIGPAKGYVYFPPEHTAPMPAVCLICGLGAGCPSLARLARSLLEQRVVVLAVEPDAESYTYPEILAILPAAVTLLAKLPEVDPQRIGVVGHDMGGDLAIRSASVDKQIKAVAVMAPLLTEASPSLDLLHEMSYWQALRWARDAKREVLRAKLTALEYGVKIAPRPLLLMHGAEDRIVANAPVEGWSAQHVVIQDAGHLNLVDHPLAVQIIVQWLKEHL